MVRSLAPVRVTALVLLPLRLGVQAIELFGADAVARGHSLLGSAWGAGWWVEMVTAVLFATGLAIAGAQGWRRGWILVGGAAVVGTLVPALSGHAVGHPRLASFDVLSDALHVAGAGSWIGGLALLVLVGLPAAREADIPRKLTPGLPLPVAMLAGFFRMAIVAVAVVVGTGLVNAWIELGSWGALARKRLTDAPCS